MKYVDVIIDNRSNSTDSAFTYACSDDRVRTGSRVLVPFAKSKKPREGYVISVQDSESAIGDDVLKKLKNVESLDAEVTLSMEAVRTALWMKGRYLCRYIDAIRCFVPAGSPAKRRTVFDSIPECGGVAEGEPARILTEEQQRALDMIRKPIEEGRHERFLIHGVTGSGKTEIYIRAAGTVLEKGRSAIVLVPEISLTGQIVERFVSRFGEEKIAVLHSGLSAGARHDQWKRINSWESGIVIGARSAVFAPVRNLGLIVADEEHEATYKSDFTPKYDAIEVAIKRLQDRDSNGVLVLGSATPSVSTYSRAEEGIYRLIKLTKRYNEVNLPKGEIVDMRDELKAGNRTVISRKLAGLMREQLDAGKQVMLFLNRRGYSTFVSCRECGHVMKCPTCGLSLTYHKNGETGRMACHYCGHEEPAPEKCPECGSTYVRYFGTGTEKIEETVGELFPDVNADRIDMDTVKKKGELKKKLKAFEKGETRILIGTQIIAKGLDFRNVGLAGIVSADASLNIPDFRSPERSFQLITQAAGRAGRGSSEGKVVIQTYSPEHYAVVMAADQDYENFYTAERKFREYMNYPPFSDIIQVMFTAESQEAAEAGAWRWHERLANMMTQEERKNLFEPQPAYMSKIRETYRYSLIIKCPKGSRQKYAGLLYVMQQEDVEASRKKKQNYIAVVDINPYSFS